MLMRQEGMTPSVGYCGRGAALGLHATSDRSAHGIKAVFLFDLFCSYEVRFFVCAGSRERAEEGARDFLRLCHKRPEKMKGRSFRADRCKVGIALAIHATGD
ncbi:unnamed protein product [Scytosiphon promiscuus]